MVLTPSAPATFRADRPERSLISRRVAGDGSRDAFTSAKRASTASDSSDPVWSRFTNSDAIRRTKQSTETKSVKLSDARRLDTCTWTTTLHLSYTFVWHDLGKSPSKAIRSAPSMLAVASR